MATSLIRDITAEFNAASSFVVDVNGWDYVIAHVVTPSGSMSFQGSNDGGEIEGSTTSNPLSATNFLALAGQPLTSTTPTTYVTSAAVSAMVRFDFPPQYIRFSGSSITVVKLIIKLHKHF